MAKAKTTARKTTKTASARNKAKGSTKRAKVATKKTKKKAMPVSKRVAKSSVRRKPRLRKSDGFTAEVTLVERSGGSTERGFQTLTIPIPKTAKTGGGAVLRKAAAGLIRAVPALAAASHEYRVKLMMKLLEGPATYKAMQQVTKLTPGPLYHHINQLRLAGLILPKQRDAYELTRGGRNLILGLLVLAPLTHDKRRRHSDHR